MQTQSHHVLCHVVHPTMWTHMSHCYMNSCIVLHQKHLLIGPYHACWAPHAKAAHLADHGCVHAIIHIMVDNHICSA